MATIVFALIATLIISVPTGLLYFGLFANLSGNYEKVQWKPFFLVMFIVFICFCLWGLK